MGCTGSSTIKTPHIDGLAERGVFCTQGYVPSSVCSPSRAGILTGRDPRRFGYEGNLSKGGDAYATRYDLQGLPVSEHTLADHLKSAGYATALIGKWHQGDSAPFHPNVRGFDHFYGMLNGSHGYFPTAENNHLQENGQPVTEFSSPYITDLGEQQDLAGKEPEKFAELFRLLGEWESSLATVPLWGSSPRWDADSANIYDTAPIPEPK